MDGEDVDPAADLTAAPTVPTLWLCRHALDSQLVHYVIVRGDLPHGLQVANVLHAAGESSDRVQSGTVAVALRARDAGHIEDIAEQLAELDIAHHLVVEGEGHHEGQPMAIGCEPSTDRARLRRVLSNLPLV